MSSSSSDRNLVFGLLALQMDFISREQLLDAMAAWMLTRQTPLGEILFARGVLDAADRADLERLADRHLQRHGGAQGSLAALRVDDGVRVDLQNLGDRDIHSTIASLAPAGSNGAVTPTDTAGARYRRVRPHAKGGLGEVFVAVDEELNREVALKEIQERFADDTDSRSRFVREAEITGNLEHPGIVPVYGLGVYADGRPFYAMRFIHGESMQVAIERFHQADAVKRRDPGERILSLRDLLTRFVAVCDAVAYGHARGIIHRDLKPANVMLGEYGETLVVDWGLARPIPQPGSQLTSAHLPVPTTMKQEPTELGQVLGTPAFMPPEQAHGQVDLMGPRSDVWALGAMLYALMTGKAPYVGTELVSQAKKGEVVLARGRNDRVPTALEAVSARAMAFNREERYANARQLGDEVRRWLADEPVDAYPEPLAERVRRRGRHHRSVVSGGVVLLLAGVVGLSLGLWAVNQEKVRTEAALGRALSAEAEATANLEQAEVNLERARKAEAEAKANEQLSQANLKLARRAVDECFNIAKEHKLFQQPRMGEAKKLLLKTTLPFYKEFRSRRPDDRRLEYEEAEQLWSVAYIEAFLGESKPAVAAYAQAGEIYSRLAAAHPDVPAYRHDLARTHNNLGVLHRVLGKREAALDEHQRARDILSRLAAAHPDVPNYRYDLAKTHNNLGILQSVLGKREAALDEYKRARDIRSRLAAAHPDVPDYRHGLAKAHNNLGLVLRQLGKREEALDEYNRARDILSRLGQAHPDVPDYQELLATTHDGLGILQSGLGKREAAHDEYQRARDIRSRLAAAHPDVPNYRYDLAKTHNNLGILQRDLGKREKALDEHQWASDIFSRLAAAYPDVPAYQRELARTHNNLGLLQSGLGKREAAHDEYQRARDIRSRLAATHPDVPDYRNELGGTLVNLSVLQRKAGKPEEALRSLAEALPHLQAVYKSEPRHPQYRQFLRNAHGSRAEILGQLNRHREAVADWDRAEALTAPAQRGEILALRAGSRARAGDHAIAAAEADALGQTAKLPGFVCYNLGCVHALNAGSARRDPALPLPSRDKLAEECAEKAVALLHRAAAAGYFAAPATVAHLDKEADLDALRSRDDYRAFRLLLGVLKMPTPEP